MCGRFTLKTSRQQLATLFADLDVELPEFKPRYNIAPTQQVLAIRIGDEHAAEAVMLRWGLIPFWAKDTSISARMINARLDTIAEKPAFRAAFKSRRCLIPADGFFEWRPVGKRKQPYHITRRDGQPFCFAGIWESWRDKAKNESIESCSIITTDANNDIASLHDRMPCVVPSARYLSWLDPEFDAPLRLLDNPPSEAPQWQFAPVNPVVNNARHEGPDCIEVLSELI